MYSLSEINKIKKHIRENWYPKDFTWPSIHLFISIFLIFVALWGINKTNNKMYLGGLIAFLALSIMRMFMTFHDLVHGSYFPSEERKTGKPGINSSFARCIDFLCCYEKDAWKATHMEHHRVHGNLNESDHTKTVYTSSQYNALTESQKTIYNVVRYPPVFFIIMPIYIFWINKFINHEWEYIAKYTLFLYLLHYIGGLKLLGCFLFAQYIGGMLGIMMFHLQHQVNLGYWKPFDNNTDIVSRANAEIYGASVLKIPFGIDFFTLGIEYHSVHHLDPGVPGYNTKDCYYDLIKMGLLKEDSKVGYSQIMKSLTYTIYDEKDELYK